MLVVKRRGQGAEGTGWVANLSLLGAIYLHGDNLGFSLADVQIISLQGECAPSVNAIRVVVIP